MHVTLNLPIEGPAKTMASVCQARFSKLFVKRATIRRCPFQNTYYGYIIARICFLFTTRSEPAELVQCPVWTPKAAFTYTRLYINSSRTRSLRAVKFVAHWNRIHSNIITRKQCGALDGSQRTPPCTER